MPTLSTPLFEDRLTPGLRERFHSLGSPSAIQAYLDGLPYVAEELDRSPLRVMADGQAHCLDGGLFAALALARLGFRPLVLDLAPEPGADDDHVLALYGRPGAWGALAKSNYPGLRLREPVYRSLRELVMSYFEHFFSVEKQKTLRGYTRPLDLASFPPDWMWSEAGVARVAKRLYARKPIALIDAVQAQGLSIVDERSYRAGTLGTDFDWAYGIRKNK